MSLSSESDRSTIGPSSGPPGATPTPDDRQEIDALPVLADRATMVRSRSSPGAISRAANDAMIPAVQAAAVAAGGFVAGVAVVGLVTRRSRRSPGLAKGRRAGRRLGRGGRARGSTPAAGELIQIVGSRSLLVDVHLLGGR